MSDAVKAALNALNAKLVSVSLVLGLATCPGQAEDLGAEVARRTEQGRTRLIETRRTLHQHPELSNREYATAKLIAERLARLGMSVRSGVAHTGVVALLRGAKPGPVVALRADMDALPVTELVDLPFASKVRSEHRGEQTGVMHACGHDAHVAILLGVAEVLAGMKSKIRGSVKFIFQPAEEGAPQGEQGGARLMLQEGVLADPAPAVIFGLHVWPEPSGTIGYRSGPAMAASDNLEIVVTGKQTHGALPWGGVDPIVVASQIVLALQTITSRQVDLTEAPAIVTIGSIHGGNRGNIIPETVTLEGTIRTFDELVRGEIHERTRRTTELVARSSGASASAKIIANNPGVRNDPALTRQMLPTLRRVAGAANVRPGRLSTASEDFGDYQRKVPGLFVFLGIVPKDKDAGSAPRNHSPWFFVDEAALPLGVRPGTHRAEGN